MHSSSHLSFKALPNLRASTQSNFRIELNPPHRVAIPFLEPVKQELKRMENLGVIAKVEQPTEWCVQWTLSEA